jgi:hypothetical protein
MTCNPHFLKTMSPETPYFAVFCYETEDLAKEIGNKNYFLPAIRMLRERDIVVVYANVEQGPSLGIFVVTRRDLENEIVELTDLSKLKIESVGDLAFRLLPTMKPTPTPMKAKSAAKKSAPKKSIAKPKNPTKKSK